MAQPTTQPRTVAMTTAEQPTEPETTAEQPTEPETTAEQPTEPETAATQPTKPEVPKPPPPKVTGKLSYMKQLSKVKSAVKSCKVVGVGALKLSILIDGPTGKATAKVLGPALVIDEDSAKCPGEKIAEIEFERFKGTYSAPPSFFDLKK